MKVGIIGAGQLGQMLALAGIPLGLQFRFYDRSADTPGSRVAPVTVGEFDDHAKLAKFAEGLDVITFDWENVSAEALRTLEGKAPVYPPPAALATSQDRLLEKQMFRELGIPTPPFEAVDNYKELIAAAAKIGIPGVLKTRRLGYDGKGQFVIADDSQLERAWEALGGVPLIYEGFVKFTREVSIIGARSTQDETTTYPLCANTHLNGILRYTIAPFAHKPLQQQAQRYLRRVMRHLNYVGLLTIEFFVVRGRLLANEIAPRVHNSGHWTIEGASISQFENHLRAILGWPLGNTDTRGHSAMINFIGTIPPAEQLVKESDVYFHDYGKEPRADRKLGHCTLLERTAEARDARLRKLLK